MSELYEKEEPRNPYDKIKRATDPAHTEANRSGLPGIHNGPGDAYRHIIGAAEITRRFGEATARAVLEGHELQGWIQGQPGKEGEMDRHNNAIGIAIGREARTLDDAIERAREKINQAAQGAEGKDIPRWLPQGEWSPGGANWPPEWEKPEVGKYPFGGEGHRYPGWRDEEAPEGDTDEVYADPLDRPIETWSEADVESVMRSDAYLRPWSPEGATTFAKVKSWFEHFYGTGPVQYDATGRAIEPRPIRPIPTGGPVRVRAYSRDDGKVTVRAHERARPG